MIKHIVQFTLNKELDSDYKSEIMNKFRNDILALKDIIPCIVDIEVGFNVNADENGDVCLNSTFLTLDDVRLYANHPAHVAAAQALKPYVVVRSCVDYMTES